MTAMAQVQEHIGGLTPEQLARVEELAIRHEEEKENLKVAEQELSFRTMLVERATDASGFAAVVCSVLDQECVHLDDEAVAIIAKLASLWVDLKETAIKLKVMKLSRGFGQSVAAL